MLILKNGFNFQYSSHNNCFLVIFANRSLERNVALGSVQVLFCPVLTFQRFGEWDRQSSSSEMIALASVWSGSLWDAPVSQGKWSRETQTGSWTNCQVHLQPDTKGHLPRDNIEASLVFQLQAQKSSKIGWETPGPAAMTNDPLPCH